MADHDELLWRTGTEVHSAVSAPSQPDAAIYFTSGYFVMRDFTDATERKLITKIVEPVASLP